MSEPVLSEAQYHAQQLEIAHLSRTVQEQQAEIERLCGERNEAKEAARWLFVNRAHFPHRKDAEEDLVRWPWLADCDYDATNQEG